MCGCVFIGWIGVEVSIWVIASRNTLDAILVSPGTMWCQDFVDIIKLPRHYIFYDLYRPTVLNLPQLAQNNGTFKR